MTLLQVFVAEITLYDDDLRAERTVYFATRGFTTTPNDLPADTYISDRLVQPVFVSRTMFASGATYGRSTAAVGDIILSNPDGLLDWMLRAGFDGRRVVVRRGDVGAAYPSAFTTVFTGTLLHPDFSSESVTLRVRDLQAGLDLPVQTEKYAGTNVLPDGLEGTPTDLAGRVKPYLLGAVRGIAPPLVNTSKLIYQLSTQNVAVVHAVYDRGVPLTLESRYTDLAEMMTVEPSPGAVRRYGAYVRLGSSPAGDITVDADQFTTASRMTAARLAEEVIQQTALGVTLRAGDAAAADTISPGVCGVFIDDEMSYADVLDVLAESVGGWWGFDVQGGVRFAAVNMPTGNGIFTFYPPNIVPPLERLKPNDDAGDIPTYSTVVTYARNYTPLNAASVAGSVSEARRETLRLPSLEVAVENNGVKTKHPLAGTQRVTSVLRDYADALALATRVQRVRGRLRHLFELKTVIDDQNIALDLNDIVWLKYPRYDLSLVGDEFGSAFLVIGIAHDVRDRSLVFTLWGSALTAKNRVDQTGRYRVDSSGRYRVTTQS